MEKMANFGEMCARGEMEGVKEALGRGVMVNTRDRKGRTGLYLAVNGKHEGVVEVLLAHHGIDVNCKSRPAAGGGAPLHRACAHGPCTVSVGIMRRLLAAPRVEVEARAKGGRTPLMVAVAAGQVDKVKLLMEVEGVNLDTRDDTGRSLEDVANKNNRIIILLRKANAARNGGKREEGQRERQKIREEEVEKLKKRQMEKLERLEQEKVSLMSKMRIKRDDMEGKNRLIMEETIEQNKEKLEKVEKQNKENMEILARENQRREAAIIEENTKELNKIKSIWNNNLAKLIMEEQSKLKEVEDKAASAMEEIKRDNEREEEELVEEQEREESEAPSCPVNILLSPCPLLCGQVCLEAMLPPGHIHQCGSGHLLCGACRPRIQVHLPAPSIPVQECPSRCGEPVLARRAFGVEQFLRERLEEGRRRRGEQGGRKRSREEELDERSVRMRVD